MRYHVLAISCVICVFTGCLTSRGEIVSSRDSRDDTTAFLDAAAHARKAWHQLGSGTENVAVADIASAQISLSQIQIQSLHQGLATIDYLKIRAAFLSGQRHEAAKQCIPSLALATYPEILLASLEIHSELPNQRQLYTECLADLLPLSVWRSQLDGQNSDFDVLIKPPRAAVPQIDRDKMIQIADAFSHAGLNAWAWKAYAEAVYVAYSPSWIGEHIDNTWVSTSAANCWARAAECAYQAGEESIAWDYLMKAAVFGDETQYKAVQGIAIKWRSGAKRSTDKGRPLVEAENPTVKQEALEKIVRLYTEMNAHPRAIAIIKANRDAFRNHDQLHDKVQQQWLAVVKDVSRAAKKVMLYGAVVFPDDHAGEVSIPWLLSTDAVASVRNRLKAAAESLPAQTRPGM